jgi:hypothetical protein
MTNPKQIPNGSTSKSQTLMDAARAMGAVRAMVAVPVF